MNRGVFACLLYGRRRFLGLLPYCGWMCYMGGGGAVVQLTAGVWSLLQVTAAMALLRENDKWEKECQAKAEKAEVGCWGKGRRE